MKAYAPNVGQAVEYLRRSVERDKSADKDRGAGQRAANAEQAARDGVQIARTFDGDWGTSGGRGHRGERHAMADLIEAVRAGEVSAIYCHTTDRLARDVEYGMTLWNVCKDAGTIIRPGSQRFDPREPGYLTLWSVLLSQAEEDLDRITRKNVDVQDFGRDHAATCPLPGRPHVGRCHLVGCTDKTHCQYAHKHGRRKYGEDPGRPEESVAAVLAAFEAAGSFLGACKVLNAQGLPTRTGAKDGWNVLTVSRIVRRALPVPPAGRQGTRAGRQTRLFSGLLRCHCDSPMSSMPRPDGRAVGYYCRAAHNNTAHPRPYVVSERFIRPWAEAIIAESYRRNASTLRDEADPGALAERTAELDAKRERVVDMYADGTLTKPERNKRLTAIEDDRARLAKMVTTGRRVRTFRIAPFDWARDPGVVNADLRDLWQRVELGADLRPVRAVWHPTEEYGEEGPLNA
jgi:hypothetical protein